MSSLNIIGEPWVLLFYLASLVYGFKAITKVFYQILRATREPGLYSLLRSGERILFVVIAVLLITLVGWREESIFIGMNISYLLVLIIFITNFSDILQELKISLFNKKIIKKLLIYGSPWIFIPIGSFMLSRADRYLIEYFLTTDVVGIYSATYTLAERGILEFVSVLTLASYPLLINSYEEAENEKFQRDLNQLLKVYFIFFIPAVTGIIFLREDIINIFLGAEFRGTGYIFAWISLAAFFEGFRNFVARHFQIEEITYYVPILLLVSGLVNLGLNLILIPRMGILGAAIATLVGYLAYSLTAFIISSSFFTWKLPYKTFLKSSIGSLGLFLLLFLLPVEGVNLYLRLVVQVIVGAGSYFVFLYLLNEELTGKFITKMLGNKV